MTLGEVTYETPMYPLMNTKMTLENLKGQVEESNYPICTLKMTCG